jgi:hypothetical protein
MEGLRICALECHLFQDSVKGLEEPELWYNVVEQYLKEPRAEPGQAVSAILNLGKWNWYSQEVLKYAQEWGGDRMANAVMERRRAEAVAY